ncbi:MAG: magnesium/cobalt transporter CorA, partial [Gemmatimonadetes bacterium]|nr:magnesium/cobalt transporter CorA [Gemmatimonadota bacterium]
MSFLRAWRRPVRTIRRAVYRLVPKRSKTPGLPPGTLVYTGVQRVERPRISVIEYDENRLEQQVVESVEDCFPFLDSPTITWINIDGLHDIGLIAQLGHKVDLHPLVLEDIVSVGQRPKLEDYEKYLFIVLRMLEYNQAEERIDSEQFCLILGAGWVISLQERAGDILDPLRERIRQNKGPIRKMGADYLAYSIIDTVVDHYFSILEKLGDRIEDLEENVVSDPTPEVLREVHHVKREALALRKAVWPLREVVGALERGESELIAPPTRLFLRDVYDHTIQVIETVETLRDAVGGMTDLYLSTVSNRMNE